MIELLDLNEVVEQIFTFNSLAHHTKTFNAIELISFPTF